ncbi:hypothetical protein GZH47_31985 (plasmid) [Paenibacillus rhizovicinus]|uniref:Glycoside hydrolase n=1 Tax=Paenibacillus rhizovicinus TaxID=2704463 RepID=A0A6C0PCW4_9BACL|nr:glycosyl hydrolase [Paenibacillus rhizovicinus]QHW35512.1 hypothetical protein GZH47_31985 [Paenibacillus rhizovicinus]
MWDKTTFREGDMAYRSAPFWSWNDKLEKEELLRQIHEMYGQGIGGFFMHPRGGIEDEYLGAAYMERIRDCVAEAERLGMKAWIYDESWCPSGNAAGKVVRRNPAFASKALKMTEIASLEDWREAQDDSGLLLKLFAAEADGTYRELQETEADAVLADGRKLLVFAVRVGNSNPQFGDVPNTDLLNPGAVDAFIDITLEPHKPVAGEHFGGAVPGVFTDEPNFGQWGKNVLPWTEGLENIFSERKGYDLLAHLPKLYIDGPDDTAKVRFDYWDLLTRLFVESFTRRMYDWCERNGLELTGHFWEHGFPSPMQTGSTMPNYAYLHAPGIDVLGSTGKDIDMFGNDLIVKEASSVANQLGKHRVMSETYGASGWDLNYRDMKRIADWQFALGVNLVVQHLVHYSLRGYRKRDFPLSFLDHQPWWPTYRKLGDYIGRLSWALAQGDYPADVLVLHSSSSTWAAYRPDDKDEAELKLIGESLKSLCRTLSSIHCQYELGDDLIMEEHGSVKDGQFIIGRSAYRVLALPAMSVMRRSSFSLLKRFADEGGAILATAGTPYLLDGEPNDELREFFASSKVMRIGAGREAIRNALDGCGAIRVQLECLDEGEPSSVYAHRRRNGEEDVLFLFNNSVEQQMNARVRLEQPWFVEQWDALTGETAAAAPYVENGAVYLDVFLPPVGSQLLLIDRSRTVTPSGRESIVAETGAVIVALDEWRAKRTMTNAWTLNRVSVALNGEAWEEERNAVEADDGLKDRLGMKRGNIFGNQPWMFDEQEKNRTFPLQAKYTFEMKELPDGELLAAAETAGLFEVTVNGRRVQATGGHYVDASFALYDIKPAVVEGKNEIVLSTDRYGVTVNLESVYIVGDFRLEGDVEAGRFAAANEPETFALGDWTRKGYPFYSGTAIYSTSASVPAKPSGRVVLELGDWHGTALRVRVNGAEAGVIGWAPNALDVTKWIRAGINEIEVEVMNSLQNLLGPHDEAPEDLVTPGSFNAPQTVYFAASGYEGGGRLRLLEQGEA